MTQKILITGASSGIGEALALEWSKHKNILLILCARNLEALKKVQIKCVQNGAKVTVEELDLADPKSIVSAVARIESNIGSPDIVIHNGGISQRSSVLESTMEVDRRLMEVNFFGTIHLTKLLLPKMLERRSGKFLVISSVVGKIGMPKRSGYSASKHALHGYFDGLRAEVSSFGVSVNLVCPGFVKTSLSLNALKGNGELHNQMDETTQNGMLPEVFAKKLISKLDRNQNEIYIGGMRERLGLFLKRFFPVLFSKIIERI